MHFDQAEKMAVVKAIAETNETTPIKDWPLAIGGPLVAIFTIFISHITQRKQIEMNRENFQSANKRSQERC